MVYPNRKVNIVLFTFYGLDLTRLRGELYAPNSCLCFILENLSDVHMTVIQLSVVFVKYFLRYCFR